MPLLRPLPVISTLDNSKLANWPEAAETVGSFSPVQIKKKVPLAPAAAARIINKRRGRHGFCVWTLCVFPSGLGTLALVNIVARETKPGTKRERPRGSKTARKLPQRKVA